MVFTNSASGGQMEVCQEAYLYLLHLLVAVNIVPRAPAAQPQAGEGGEPPSDASKVRCGAVRPRL